MCISNRARERLPSPLTAFSCSFLPFEIDVHRGGTENCSLLRLAHAGAIHVATTGTNTQCILPASVGSQCEPVACTIHERIVVGELTEDERIAACQCSCKSYPECVPLYFYHYFAAAAASERADGHRAGESGCSSAKRNASFRHDRHWMVGRQSNLFRGLWHRSSECCWLVIRLPN